MAMATTTTDIRKVTFVALSTTLLFATVYSVSQSTYLDTSDPVIALGGVKHHLHNYSYFARKHNILNTVFIKKSWGWTSAAFFSLWLTAPSAWSSRQNGARARVMSARERLLKWGAATLVWLCFAAWFFGPAILERLNALTGAQCVVRFPSGEVHSVPIEYCFSRSMLSSSTHPHVFTEEPTVLGEPLKGEWSAIPRLMRGHDVSGHIFLLTMSLLFLADMIKPSLDIPASSRSLLHNIALTATGFLMAIWVFAIFVTGVYWHTPFEKLTGYGEKHASFILESDCLLFVPSSRFDGIHFHSIVLFPRPAKRHSAYADGLRVGLFV